ncbi:MAG: calcium-binding protein, partial [Coxiellaceae bacterium]|nr:calcium-binding protein [Coxiellaceae bacterium]
APTISSSSNFTGITEDQTNNVGNDVSDLASIADVDSGAASGIAVHTIDSSNGTWQYSTDSGSSWTAVGQVSASNALLLASTDKIRFVPDGNNTDSADIDFYGWDQSSGSAGGYADASTRGGSTAFSSGTDSSSITVSAVNDAPTISSSSNFTGITEDQTNNVGNDVSDLASIADVDSGAASGIAVHTIDSSNGTWQYSTDSGSSWTAVGQVSASNALLLASTDKIRFVPDGNNADAADLDFYGWDQSSGSAGGYADASTRGGSTAFSSGTDSSSITVSAVNDAPTISSSSNFTGITEDQTNNVGNDVSDLASIADVDSGAASGIAVHTIDSSNGTWQYSTDSGSSWTAVGQVSASNALLLGSTDKIRFVPDGNNTDSADIDFYGWDQSSGSAGGYADASTRGGSTAFSSGTDSSSITVSAVNDAPTISSSSNFTGITEDQTNNVGNDVSDLASIADVDSGASSGIAVHTIDSSNGTWQYSTDSGSSWTAVGQVSASNALLLASTDKIRFVPDGNNTDSADIDFYGWDQSSGSAGGYADASTRGGSTAFSSGTDSSSITVSAVNDAPTLTADTPDLTTITEDDTSNSGDTVANVLGNTLADVDTGASEGIAIYGSAVTTGGGTWQYKVGNGSWTAMSSLGESTALLLGASDSVRFVPDGLNEAVATLSYYGWDQTSGSAGNQVDASTRGGTTAFSSDGDVASISVTEVGDTYVLTSADDTVLGGSADDTIQSTQANYNIGDSINGAGGANTFALQGGGQFSLTNNISNVESVTVADDGTYTLTLTSITGLTTIDATALTGGNEITVDGSTYTSTLIISGGAGGNTLTGGTAADIIVGGAESDIITGGAGADTLTGYAGADELIGGAGADTLTGGDGSDELSGGDGADTLIGGDGADTLTGGAGIDTLQGDAGDDTFIYDASAVDLSVDGGADTDTLSLDSSAVGVTIDLTAIADNVYANIETIDITGSGGNNLTLAEADVLAINASGILTIDGDIDDFVTLGVGWNFISSADGYERYDASLGVVYVNSFVSTDQQGGQGIDPIIIDLNNDGISLISHNDSQVRFDMTGDGQLNKTAWANSADAILAYDINDNGFIDNIHEVFSERFNGESYSNAVEALSAFDLNQDNLIDANDLVYQDLVLWQDRNSDGISDDGELSSLADMGVEHIDLAVSAIDMNVEQSTILSEGAVQFNDGTTAVFNEVSFYVTDDVSNNEEAIENFVYDEQASDALFGALHGDNLTAPDQDTLLLYNQEGELFNLKISMINIEYGDILGSSNSEKLLESLNSLNGEDSLGLHELNHPALQLEANDVESIAELTDNSSFIVTDEVGNEYNLASGEFSAKEVVEINGETFVHYVNQQATEGGSIDLYINNNHTAMLG